MWKIGPECATQQAKCTRAMSQNCGLRAMSRSSRSRSGASDPAVTGAAPRPAAVAPTTRASGIVVSHAMSPSTSIAVRQSYWVISQRTSGATAKLPRPAPADTRPIASPRFVVKVLLTMAVSGA